MTLTAEKISRQFIRKRGSSNILEAVRECSISLNPGEITVLCGASGSGKTTLLNIMAGLLSPSTGRVLLDDRDIYAMDDESLSKLRCSSFGVIPQGQTPIASMTISENVLLPFTLKGKRPDPEREEEVRKRAGELMRKSGIADLADERPSELSGGELRRMAVARALLLSPDVIFADEPTGDLDPENAEAVLRLLKEAAVEGKAVFLVTHDANAIPLGDHVYKMSAGSIERAGE